MTDELVNVTVRREWQPDDEARNPAFTPEQLTLEGEQLTWHEWFATLPKRVLTSDEMAAHAAANKWG